MEQIDWLNTFHDGAERLRKVSDPSRLATGSVLLDNVGVAWQRTFSGSWRSTLNNEAGPDFLADKFGPLRLLHDSSGGAS